jgi:hypothetical protein
LILEAFDAGFKQVCLVKEVRGLLFEGLILLLKFVSQIVFFTLGAQCSNLVIVSFFQKLKTFLLQRGVLSFQGTVGRRSVQSRWNRLGLLSAW